MVQRNGRKGTAKRGGSRREMNKERNKKKMGRQRERMFHGVGRLLRRSGVQVEKRHVDEDPLWHVES